MTIQTDPNMPVRADIGPGDLSFAIPTNGRPQSLGNGIASIRQHVGPKPRILVLNSTPKETDAAIHDQYIRLAEADPNLLHIRLDHNVGPSEARQRMAEACETDFILFMDDDHEITAGAFEVLGAALIRHDLDIVAGRWIEEDSERALGFVYKDGFDHDGTRWIEKFPIRYHGDLAGRVIRMDDVLATMLCRRTVFDRVRFDAEFDFFFELFDFFMSCAAADLRVAAASDAVFLHKPTRYRSVSMRQTQDQQADAARFRDKWGAAPKIHGLHLPPPSFVQRIKRKLRR
ncbi:glycosyltransferase family 2 protein [Gymnodinialimonas sp. 2305UL16-5]|uniref:glycosyltransferase family 2 protein n=1 Tax=Gymnodinialimonas mytili TaxID=3126503 RepID=UPI0030A7A759